MRDAEDLAVALGLSRYRVGEIELDGALLDAAQKLDVLAECATQAVALELGRTQLEHEHAQLVEDVLSERLQLRHLLTSSRRIALEQRRRRLRRQYDAEELLADRVVKVEREGLLDQVKTGGAYLMGLLREALGDRPYIGDLRGRGYFIGIELVEERASKEPFPPALQLFARVRDQSFANGLICYPTGGNVDGVKGDQIILAPPYNASRAELEEIVDTLQRSLSEVMAALPKKR